MGSTEILSTACNRFLTWLDKAGYDSYVEMPKNSGDKIYRVKVGRFHSKEAAEKLAAKLKVRGYPTKICEN